MTSKGIAAHLGQNGLCVCPSFLSPKLLEKTVDDFDRLHTSGAFRRAGVGRGNHGQRTAIRNDETYWLNEGEKNPAHRHLWRKLDLLKYSLNRNLFLGLKHFEGHYAAYPEGGFYERHKDCFRGDSGRIVSFVLYLNRDWKAADGGRLRLFSSSVDGKETSTDIDPIGGTMVCFMSNESEHQVLLSHKLRRSLTGWFKR